MTKSKFFRLAISVLCVMAFAFSFSLCAEAAADTRYTNPDTNYQIVIIDDLDLLTDEEEKMLVEDMKPVTAYGNAAFWTTEEYAYNEIDQARLKRKELFNSCSKTAFSQILTVCEKRHISEPLKISGYVVISLMAGLILAIGIAFSKEHNPLLQSYLYENGMPFEIQGGFKDRIHAVYVTETTVHRPPVSSSSGSSCSSCSSCGGGGCGSGGSSSF